MTLDESVNEVLRKIGRNIMLFQELEHLLKFIISNGEFSGYASEIVSNKKKKVATINKQTMGQLIGQYLETTNPEYQNLIDEPKDLKEPFFSFKFHTECDSAYYETKKTDLAQIVFDRNELIHHILPKFNTKSVKSCLEMENQLDLQKEKTVYEIELLKQKINSLEEGKKILIKFISSDEGKKQIEISWLRQSPLVLLLVNIAVESARADGWTLINKAGQLVKQHAPEEIVLLKDRYGHKSLKALMLATEIFDILEEPTDKGFRLLYKLKSGWNITNA